ncbi:serine hydrolase domain-containing protein [Acuticoccus sp.]|uniref:serine hydrolase domain-containing protein n=1 Tax=Acuticoccus sp. TaxID=1904378 RepID=UPI003B517A9E
MIIDARADDAPVWEEVAPKHAGFDPDRLAEAVEYAATSESDWPRSMRADDGRFIGCVEIGDRPPYDMPLGPVTPRGPANGLVLRGGRLVAEWGDTRHADMTFSIAKSYLALLAGLAVDRGLIGGLDALVAATVEDGGFDDAHNRSITWRHLLEQTSEWHGTLFDRPDQVDWHRVVGAADTPAARARKGEPRTLQPPGTHFEYNDVRVNRLALSLLRVFGRALPELLADEVMGPIGASSTWRWDAYQNATVDVAGTPMPSVPGGGHWGGGLVIAARDHARVGELVVAGGRWDGRQIVSSEWVRAMLTPSAIAPIYGLMWWLNTDRALYPSAPKTSAFALGAGSNILWVDPALDLVVVLRWVRKAVAGEVIGRFAAALTER